MLENKYSFSVSFEKKLFQFNWKTHAGVERKEDGFSANDSCLGICFPLPLRWVREGKVLGTNPRRWSHHWPPLVNLFGLKREEVKQTQGEKKLGTTTRPVSVHSGKPDASCFHVFKYKTCVLYSHSQCSRASWGIGHFWRQYLKNKNLFALVLWLPAIFFFSSAPPPFLRITCIS